MTGPKGPFFNCGGWMRNLEGGLASRVESGAARLCHVWLLERRDGMRAGFTDHDRPLDFEGVICRADSGWTAGAARAAEGLDAGGYAVAGGLDDAGLSESEIAEGLYDGARVQLWRVDWQEPTARVRLWCGTLCRIRREGEGFVADLEGPLAALDRVVGRTYGRDCDAVLGDERCGLTAEAITGRTCDRSWRTCTGVFGNGVNFRGFPDVPGDDFIFARPEGGARHDGGSRR